MGKKAYLFGGIVLTIFIVGFLANSFFSNYGESQIPPTNLGEQTKHVGTLCVNFESADGLEVWENCRVHNMLYDTGENITRDFLFSGGNATQPIQISLCNATADGCASPLHYGGVTDTFTIYEGCGLEPANGTVTMWEQEGGNVSIWTTFTHTCTSTSTSNVSRIGNGSLPLAGANITQLTFSADGDQATINWTIDPN